MKKIYSVFLVLGMLFFGAKSVLAYNVGVGASGIGATGPSGDKLTCTDTDAKDIYKRGSVNYAYINADGIRATNTMYDECSGSGLQVNEMWCYGLVTNGVESMVPGRMVYDCKYGCINGACKITANANPTLIPTPTASPGKLTCVDTDASDIYTRGRVTYTYIDKNNTKQTNVAYDECNGSGTQLNEMWCYKTTDGSENFVPGRMVYNCPKGCVNGACKKTGTLIVKKAIPTPTKKPSPTPTIKAVKVLKGKSTCSDSDNLDIYKKGSVVYTNRYGKVFTVNDGCYITKKSAIERICYENPVGSGNYISGSKVINCPSKKCVNGACVK